MNRVRIFFAQPTRQLANHRAAVARAAVAAAAYSGHHRYASSRAGKRPRPALSHADEEAGGRRRSSGGGSQEPSTGGRSWEQLKQTTLTGQGTATGKLPVEAGKMKQIPSLAGSIQRFAK
jgi:hypothetical protein